MLNHLIAKWPGLFLYHQWITFLERANSRPRWVEPDLFLPTRDTILLLEIKLTGCPEGHIQMSHLYAPLLHHIYTRPVRCLQVCKWTDKLTPGPFFKSPEAFMCSKEPIGTWQAVL